MDGFLPVSKADMEKQGIEQLDFIMVTGDAYVDHPSFAHAIISRYLGKLRMISSASEGRGLDS